MVSSRSLLCAFAAICLVKGHTESEPRHETSWTVPGLANSLGRRDVSAGGSCGPSAGNSVCATGLCCSSNGVCGTGAAFCSAPDCQLSFGPGCDGNQTPPGKDTSGVPRPLLGSVPYGVSLSHCTVNGKVALTFDDGPYLYTSELLDILKKNNVKATFFIVGNNAGKGQIELSSTGYPSLIQRVYAEGHQLGSHSWSHQDLSKITAQQRRDQIIRNEIAFVDILGFFPTYFRPPYTNCPADCLKDLGDLGYHVANYDIDTRDWQGDYTYAQNLYNSILTQHSPGSSSWISLAHDVQPNTVHAFAQYMIDQAKKLGYELVRLGDCLGDPEANWYRNPADGQAWVAKAAASASTSTQALATNVGTSLLLSVTLSTAVSSTSYFPTTSSSASAMPQTSIRQFTVMTSSTSQSSTPYSLSLLPLLSSSSSTSILATSSLTVAPAKATIPSTPASTSVSSTSRSTSPTAAAATQAASTTSSASRSTSTSSTRPATTSSSRASSLLTAGSGLTSSTRSQSSSRSGSSTTASSTSRSSTASSSAAATSTAKSDAGDLRARPEFAGLLFGICGLLVLF